jgi:outer membrane protein
VLVGSVTGSSRRALKSAGKKHLRGRRGLQAKPAGLLMHAILTAALASFAPNAAAETLLEALAATYGYNPRLDAQRAFQRGTDEEVARAKSGYRPSITGTADIGLVRGDTRPSSTADGVTKPRGLGVSLVQPLFRGFQTYNAVNEAEATVRAQREILRDVERSVLLQAVTAYMDVVRDEELVRVNEDNVNVLTRELDASQDRYDVQEITRTDVAQAEARRADAVSRLDAARANLRTSRGAYKQVVGHEPSSMAWPPPPDEHLPPTLNEAIAICKSEDPLVVSALYREQSAKYVVDRIRGELLPTVQLEASYSDRFGSSKFSSEQETASVVGRAIIPIYHGGDVAARVRQAKQNHIGFIQQIEQVRSERRQVLIAAWSQLQAARARLESDRIAVESNKVALDGVREEEKAGQRTLLDLLNAELEYLNAQVALKSDQRDLVVAAYSVVAAMGRLDAAWIGAAGKVYDPVSHYNEVKDKWLGLSITHGDGRRESFRANPGEGQPTVK